MFTFEKVIFTNPVSPNRRDGVEYMILDENKNVLFGEYSETMQSFYEEAHETTVLEQTDDLEKCLRLLEFAYKPLLEAEFLLFVQKHKKWSTKQKIQRIYNYHNGKLFYILPSDENLPKSSYSIFHRYLCRDALPNDDENINRIREGIDEILFDIKYYHYTDLTQSYHNVAQHALA